QFLPSAHSRQRVETSAYAVSRFGMSEPLLDIRRPKHGTAHSGAFFATSNVVAQSRLGSGVFWRGPRLCLILLRRCISSSRASLFSSSRVVLDFGSSVPRNFSSALPTESFVVSAIANLIGCFTSPSATALAGYHRWSRRDRWPLVQRVSNKRLYVK